MLKGFRRDIGLGVRSLSSILCFSAHGLDAMIVLSFIYTIGLLEGGRTGYGHRGGWWASLLFCFVFIRYRCLYVQLRISVCSHPLSLSRVILLSLSLVLDYSTTQHNTSPSRTRSCASRRGLHINANITWNQI